MGLRCVVSCRGEWGYDVLFCVGEHGVIDVFFCVGERGVMMCCFV